jgi:glycerol-3-phosphate dehydrogenase
MIAAASDRTVEWEVLVIGGGATGLGIAVDAAARGYRTLLLEKGDFAHATSSRSTKLIHGGVRYLQQGNIKLVREALRERGLLMKNARHLAHPLRFVIPNANPWERLFYGTGLKIYDAMAGRYGMDRTGHLSREQTIESLPTLKPDAFAGGTAYTDGQFDDARLAIALARTAAQLGAVMLNYASVAGFSKAATRISGVIARDVETGREMMIRAKVVINATGVFADQVRRLDDASAAASLSPSQGAHLVLPKSFLPGNSALMIPKTDDGRVLFAIPWHERVLVGTTDTAVNTIEAAPRPLASEFDFLLTHAGRYLIKAPQKTDVLCTFAGLRPLAATPTSRHSALIPRDHHIDVSASGLITITGGKWTTYRRMAKDAVDRATLAGNLAPAPCRTEELRLHGCPSAKEEVLSSYGSDHAALQRLTAETENGAAPLHSRLPYSRAEVIWATRFEMARTVEDVLARRTRSLFLDARASLEIAGDVAALMARELGRDRAWEQEQVRQFETEARRYLPA